MTWDTCPVCDGDGDYRVDDPMGLGEDVFARCTLCDGEGVISHEDEDEEGKAP